MKKTILKKLFFMLAIVACLGIAGQQEVLALTLVAGAQSPVVFTSITPKTTKVQVYVHGETTLYVKKGKALLAKKYYKSEGIKTITIPKQKVKSKLNFYVKNKGGEKPRTSKTTTVSVVSKAKKVALTAPKLNFNAGTTELRVRGKAGSKVYIRKVTGSKNGKWAYQGLIFGKEGNTKMIAGFDTCKTYSTSEYYEVRLKDLNGQYSKITKLELTSYVPTYLQVSIH